MRNFRQLCILDFRSHSLGGGGHLRTLHPGLSTFSDEQQAYRSKPTTHVQDTDFRVNTNRNSDGTSKGDRIRYRLRLQAICVLLWGRGNMHDLRTTAGFPIKQMSHQSYLKHSYVILIFMSPRLW